MANRVSFSGLNLGLQDIAFHYRDMEDSFRLFFSQASANYQTRFFGYAIHEIEKELRDRLRETDLALSMSVLASVEATFRIDYLQRCYGRKKDPLSRAFRLLDRRKQRRVSFEDDILKEWAKEFRQLAPLISQLRGAFKFRHWLAHGRYWTPLAKHHLDFNEIYRLAENITESFPFIPVEKLAR